MSRALMQKVSLPGTGLRRHGGTGDGGGPHALGGRHLSRVDVGEGADVVHVRAVPTGKGGFRTKQQTANIKSGTFSLIYL